MKNREPTGRQTWNPPPKRDSVWRWEDVKTKIIAAFYNLVEAQAAAKRLAATGVATNVMASKLRRLWRETRQTKSPVESPE